MDATCFDCKHFGVECIDMIGTEPAGSCFEQKVYRICLGCEYYMPVNQTGGICIHDIKTKKEKQQPSDGYDDFVDPGGSCRNWKQGRL